MDLIKLDLEKLEFRDKIDDAERQAITTSRRKRVSALCGVTALVGGGASAVTLILGTVALIKLIGFHHPAFVMLVILAGSVCATASLLGFAYRYGFGASERKVLALLSEPGAKAFIEANWDRRKRLLDEAAAFDLALGVFKGLPERAGDEVNEAVAANFEERRARIESETETYIGEFERATLDDRWRVAGIEERRRKPKDPRKRDLSEFADKVRQLAWVERSLDGLGSPVEAGMTVDLSPYVAAQRLRGELEEEHAALVARGLKPKNLPKPRAAARKLLPATT